MGKKDATQHAQVTPVEQHRKQIGKEDNKKTKAETKQVKKRHDLKKSVPASRRFSNVLWFLFLLLLVLIGVYLFLYYYLQYQSDQVKYIVEIVDKFWREKIRRHIPIWENAAGKAKDA